MQRGTLKEIGNRGLVYNIILPISNIGIPYLKVNVHLPLAHWNNQHLQLQTQINKHIGI